TRSFFVLPAAMSPRRQVSLRLPFFAFASLQARLPFSFGAVTLPANAGTVPLRPVPAATLGPALRTVTRKASLPPTTGRFGLGLIFSCRSALAAAAAGGGTS